MVMYINECWAVCAWSPVLPHGLGMRLVTGMNTMTHSNRAESYGHMSGESPIEQQQLFAQLSRPHLAVHSFNNTLGSQKFSDLNT